MASRIIENMKKNYYELLNKYSVHKSQPTLMREQWVDLMIKRVLSAKEILHTEGIDKLPAVTRAALEKYDVITVYKKHTLVKRSKEFNPKNKKIQKVIIPLESSFEIVFNAHLCTRHGSSNDMFDWIDRCNYAIATVCTPVLREVCRTMNSSCSTGIVEGLTILPLRALEPLANPHPTKDMASVSILNMTWQPDNSFQYLLVYKDLKTNFVQLRPLTATNLVEEIAMELMKLFFDFSPPKAVMVAIIMKDIFAAVLDRLNTVFPTEISLQTCEALDVDSLIKVKLKNWMTSNESTSWSFGCHFVQWDINNTGVYDKSAFEKFFGIKYIVNKPRKSRKALREAKKSKSEGSSTISKTTQNNNPISTIKRQNHLDISESINENDTQVSTNVARESVIQKNPIKTHSNSIAVQNSTQILGNIKKSTISSTAVDVKNSSTTDVINSTSPPNVPLKEERENYIFIKTETHVCCTCEVVIETDVYFCCVCNKSLHLYCGASKQNSKGDMESICFLCL